MIARFAAPVHFDSGMEVTTQAKSKTLLK
jgi:hypothetical protein